MENLILDTDSYKFSHWKQYPPNTTWMFSYLESRGGKYDSTVFFGLQYILKKYFSQKITKEMVDEAREISEAHGEPFNYDGWMYIVNELKGNIPLRIRAVKEGTVVPTHNVLMTVESTDSNVFWVVSWFETLLMRIWYPITVATQSYNIKKIIRCYLDKTSDAPEQEIDFKLHDFGSRGVSSKESAEIGGLAHLVNFMGTDTVAALIAGKRYYYESMAGFSIPAAEHSTITMWGKENESKAYENMINQYAKPNSLYAVVSDSYDLYNAVENIWGGELKYKVQTSGGTLVVRPDSGHPPDVVLKTVQLLEKKFGSTFNSKGYKVLDGVRVIQGDGVEQSSIIQILEYLVLNGYSASNVAFGMGGALLQKVNRDTQKFAFKCSAAIVDNKLIDVFKDPITDSGKRSKAGVLDLVFSDGKFVTRRLESTGQHPDSVLQLVFDDGRLHNEQALAEIRAQVNLF